MDYLSSEPLDLKSCTCRKKAVHVSATLVRDTIKIRIVPKLFGFITSITQFLNGECRLFRIRQLVLLSLPLVAHVVLALQQEGVQRS